MDRPTVYTQEQGRSVDFLFAARSTMIGLGKLAQAAFGSNTVVRGLAVTPNSPAALNVLVGIGEIYSLADVDATAWGALPADTTDIIVKQGLNMAAQTISTPAPATSGFSVAYLIECQYQDQDTNAAVLPYYNSNNPQIPLNGQGGNGAPQATQRQGFCVIQAKAGIAAATGTQVTPSVDSGWTAIAVVTVANGATTVTSGNISIPAGVPLLSSLLQMMQTGSAVYAVDTSTTANTITLALTPAVTSYSDGEPIRFKAANTNTGPCTINWGGGSIALNGANGALQGNEIIAGKQYEAEYNSTTGTAILLGQTAGALQVAPATQSNHAVQFGQLTGLVGSTRNAKMSVTAASASATFTADQVVVATALNGVEFLLPSYSQTINLATTGAGGMDTGAAPVSGYVALYAIYNPTTKTASILGTNVTSAAAPTIYGGANMPAGYTASALISVWPTSAGSLLAAGYQVDREVWMVPITAINTSSQTSTPTPLSLASIVPINAKTCAGGYNIGSSAITNFSATIAGSSGGIGQIGINSSSNAAGESLATQFTRLPLITAQTLLYTAAVGAGTMSWQINISGYTF